MMYNVTAAYVCEDGMSTFCVESSLLQNAYWPVLIDYTVL